MTDYVYHRSGRAIGFRRGKYIHDMHGRVVGQVQGDTHVHRLTGPYVGELYDDMIVDRHLGNRGNIGNPGDPGNPGSPGNPGNRGGRGCLYPDVSGQLFG